mmetsp:Transcript_68990/g.152194  ORF Transcript_68990/g.152194 Transcript_68990/m.152194 type:complete len:209 (+) Transcript_68990:689-1315(+)
MPSITWMVPLRPRCRGLHHLHRPHLRSRICHLRSLRTDGRATPRLRWYWEKPRIGRTPCGATVLPFATPSARPNAPTLGEGQRPHKSAASLHLHESHLAARVGSSAPCGASAAAPPTPGRVAPPGASAGDPAPAPSSYRQERVLIDHNWTSGRIGHPSSDGRVEQPSVARIPCAFGFWSFSWNFGRTSYHNCNQLGEAIAEVGRRTYL